MSKAHAALRSVQSSLENLYALERAPDVVEFVRTGRPSHREALVLRQHEDELEIALVLPPLRDFRALHDLRTPHDPSDTWLQLVEGVSHFVYVAERARTELPTTRLELELQAEVDKFVLLAFAPGRVERDTRALHSRLYEQVHYLDPAESEAGARYRLANDLAARFVVRVRSHDDPLRSLRRFYRAGQAEKIHLARAA